MDHLRISGTEPSSVILSQTFSIKSWKVMPKNIAECDVETTANHQLTMDDL